VNQAAREALAPFERAGGENPYAVQHELQEMMQDLVGIVRREAELSRAVAELGKLKTRAARVGVSGNREYNPAWHTALDLKPLLAVSEVIIAAALARKESRGGHFRDDYPEKAAELGKLNYVVELSASGPSLRPVPVPELPETLQRIVEANK